MSLEFFFFFLERKSLKTTHFTSEFVEAFLPVGVLPEQVTRLLEQV